MFSAVFVSAFLLTTGGQVAENVRKTAKEGSPLMWYLVKQVDKLHQEVKDLKTKTPTMTELEKVKSNVRKLQNSTEGPVVYFTAYTSASQTYCTNNKVKFDTVEANKGGGYNPTTGVFTAPVSGIYSFSLAIQSTGKGFADFAIEHSGDSIVLVTLKTSYDSRSMTTNFSVKKNHRVYVEMVWGQYTCTQIRAQKFTRFSGALLHTE